MLSSLFQDKRLVAAMFLAWGAVVLTMFATAGVFESKFVSFGPSDHIKFLEMKIDTWPKWAFVAAFGILDSAIWELAHEAITPWAINSVLDPKCSVLPYSKRTCLLVIESYYLHGMLVGPFVFWISLTQLDLVLLKGLATMLMRVYSHYQYIKHKEEAAYAPVMVCAPEAQL